MKKSLLLFAFTFAIFTITTAFVLNDTPATQDEVSEVPNDYMTPYSIGLNLNESGELEIMDTDRFKVNLENMMSDIGYDYKIKNIIANEVVTEGQISSTSFTIQYKDEVEEHTAKVSYSTAFTSAKSAAKIVPICISMGCTKGCNGQISAAGVFSCSACTGGMFAVCLKGVAPVW